MFPPFDPESDDRKPRGRMFARGQIPTRMLIPNIFTLLGLCAGLTAIRMAIEHRWDLAVAALVFAAFLDGIDGRIARLLKAQSRFGAELDSLADFVNFGVAPAIIIYNWALDDLKSMGWIVVLIYAVCAALRLARFNVALERTDQPAWQKSYFVGVPAAAGAHNQHITIKSHEHGNQHTRTERLGDQLDHPRQESALHLLLQEPGGEQ